MAGIIRKMLFGLVLEDAIVGEEHSYRFYEVAQRKVERKDALQLQRSGVWRIFSPFGSCTFSCAKEYPPIYDQGIKYGR